MIELDTKRKIMKVYVAQGTRIPWSYLLSVFDESGCAYLHVIDAEKHYKNMKSGITAARNAIRAKQNNMVCICVENDIFVYYRIEIS